MGFLVIPDTYYDNLRARLKDAPIKVKEDLNVVSCFFLNQLYCTYSNHHLQLNKKLL